MRTILCNITAERQETISRVISPSIFSLSLTDVATIPVGSRIDNTTTGTFSTIKAVQHAGYIEVFDETFAPTAGDIVVISSTFRYSNLESTIESFGSTLTYEGRLQVNSISESYGTFIDKKQVISNANISILNLDGKLSDIFHSYKLYTGATVELLYGDTNNAADFTKYFFGITATSSNFTYDDSIFSFSVKDFRADMLDALVPPNTFDPNLFSTYRTFNTNSSVAKLVVDSVPVDWYVGMPISTPTGSAVISSINLTELGITSYTNTINKFQQLSSMMVTTTATVQTVVVIDTSINLLGDTGHFIGIADDVIPQTLDLFGALPTQQISTTIFNPYPGQPISVSTPVNTGVSVWASGKIGIIDSVTITLANPSIVPLELQIIVGTVTKSVDVPNYNTAGLKTINVSHLNIRVYNTTTVVTMLPTIKRLNVRYEGSTILAEFYYDCTFTAATALIKPRRSVGGSVTTVHTIDLAAEGVTTSPTNTGNIFFTRTTSKNLSNTNNCRISLQLKAASGDRLSYSDIINSGLSIPTEILGSPITTVTFYSRFIRPSNFVDAVELYSLSVSYKTNVVSGTTGNMGGKPIPILYGDFSDTPVPAILIGTTTDRTFGVDYTFNNNGTITNSLLYTKIVSGVGDMRVGDSIRYTAAGTTAEKIYAKIIQIVPNINPDTGTIYFEDFTILPDSLSTITVEREVNTYKVCDSQLSEISNYYYLPNKSDILFPLPIFVTSSVPIGYGTATGEFTLTGSNLADKIFINCKGKADVAGILIEDPVAIIEDLSTSIGFPMPTTVVGTVNQVKMRRYIDKELKFSEFLSSIEADANIYTYMSADNVLTIKRFASTNIPTRTYYEHNVIQDTFQESYDPDNVFADGSIMYYNYSPYEQLSIKSVATGSSAATNTIDSVWLWRDSDAKLINDQLFSVINKLPELILVSIAADDVLSINLGEVIKVIHNGAEHILFVYTYVKNTEENSIEVVGWNLANGYNIDFPLPDFAEFPLALRNEPYIFRQWLLNDQKLTNGLGNYDVNTVTSEGFRVSTTGTVTQKTAGVNSIEATNSVLITKPQLGADTRINLNMTYLGSLGITIGTCSELEIDAITGNKATDVFTIIVDNPNQATTTLLIPAAIVGKEYILIYFNDGLIINNLEIFYTQNNNLAEDRYNFWNPGWYFKNKQYYLNRYNIQGLPPSGLCVSKDGVVVDNIKAFKGL